MLIDVSSGEVVHVHLQAILDQQAAHGRIPQLSGGVPLRLTRELVDALGPTGVEGVFRSSCEHTLRLLQTEAVGKALLTLLEAFADDPLREWEAASGLDGAGLRGGAKEMQARMDAEVALLQVQQKLAGTDEHTVVSVESRAQLLIQQATDEALLMGMPAEWQAWL